MELEPCSHPTIMNDMCAECGADLRKDDIIGTASVPMVHAIPDLKVSEEVSNCKCSDNILMYSFLACSKVRKS